MMQARMSNPTMILPEATRGIQALLRATENLKKQKMLSALGDGSADVLLS